MPGSAGTALLASLTELEQRLRHIKGLPDFQRSEIKAISSEDRWEIVCNGMPLKDFIEDMLSIIDLGKNLINNGPDKEFENIIAAYETFVEKFPEELPRYPTNNKYNYIVQLALLQCAQQIYDGQLIQEYVKEIWFQIPWKKIATFIKQRKAELEEQQKQEEATASSGAPTPSTAQRVEQNEAVASSSTSALSPEEGAVDNSSEKERDWIDWGLGIIESNYDGVSSTLLIPGRVFAFTSINPGLLDMIDGIAGTLRNNSYTNTYIGALNADKQQVASWGAEGQLFNSSYASIHRVIANSISKVGTLTLAVQVRFLGNMMYDYQQLKDVLLDFPDNLIGARYHKVKEKRKNGSYVDVDKVEYWYFIDGNQPPQRPIEKRSKQPIPQQDGHQTKGELVRKFKETEEALINYIAEHIFPQIAAINTRLFALSNTTSKLEILVHIKADIESLSRFLSNRNASILLPAFEKYKKTGQAFVDMLLNAASVNVSLEQKLLQWLPEKLQQVYQIVFADYQERNLLPQAVAAAYPAHAQLKEAIAALQAALTQSDIPSEALADAIRCAQEIRGAGSTLDQRALDDILVNQCRAVTEYEYFYEALLPQVSASCQKENAREWAKLERDAESKIKIAQAKIGSIEMFKQIASPAEIEKRRELAESDLRALQGKKARLATQIDHNAQVLAELSAKRRHAGELEQQYQSAGGTLSVIGKPHDNIEQKLEDFRSQWNALLEMTLDWPEQFTNISSNKSLKKEDDLRRVAESLGVPSDVAIANIKDKTSLNTTVLQYLAAQKTQLSADQDKIAAVWSPLNTAIQEFHSANSDAIVLSSQTEDATPAAAGETKKSLVTLLTESIAHIERQQRELQDENEAAQQESERVVVEIAFKEQELRQIELSKTVAEALVMAEAAIINSNTRQASFGDFCAKLRPLASYLDPTVIVPEDVKPLIRKYVSLIRNALNFNSGVLPNQFVTKLYRELHSSITRSDAYLLDVKKRITLLKSQIALRTDIDTSLLAQFSDALSKAEEGLQRKVGENNDIRMQAQRDAQVLKEGVAQFHHQKLDEDLAVVRAEIDAFEQTDLVDNAAQLQQKRDAVVDFISQLELYIAADTKANLIKLKDQFQQAVPYLRLLPQLVTLLSQFEPQLTRHADSEAWITFGKSEFMKLCKQLRSAFNSVDLTQLYESDDRKLVAHLQKLDAFQARLTAFQPRLAYCVNDQNYSAQRANLTRVHGIYQTKYNFINDLKASFAALMQSGRLRENEHVKLVRLTQAMELLKKQHNDVKLYITLGNYIAHMEISLAGAEALSNVDKMYLLEILAVLKTDFVNNFQPHIFIIIQRRSQAVADFLQGPDNQTILQPSVIQNKIELRMKNLWLMAEEESFLPELIAIQKEILGLLACATACVENMVAYNEFKVQCEKGIKFSQEITSYDDILATTQSSIAYLQARVFELAALKSFLINQQHAIEISKDSPQTVRQQLQQDHAVFRYYRERTLLAEVYARDAADKEGSSEVHRRLQATLEQNGAHPLATIPVAYHETVNKILVLTVKAHDLLEEFSSGDAVTQISEADYQKLEMSVAEIARLIDTIRKRVQNHTIEYLQAKHTVLQIQQQTCQTRVAGVEMANVMEEAMQPMDNTVRAKPVLCSATGPEPEEIMQVLQRARNVGRY